MSQIENKTNSEKTRPEIYANLGDINFLSHRWLQRQVDILPVLLLLYALTIYFFFSQVTPVGENRIDEFQITGFIGYAAILFVLKVVFQKASNLVNELWQRKVFDGNSKEELIRFSSKLEALANHKILQSIFFIGALLIPLVGIIYSCSEQNATGINLLFCNYQKGWLRSSKAILEAVVGVILIFMVWRVFVIAWGIRKLGKDFNITPNWHHPDKSGGLLPIGRTCFWMAGVVAIPATYLGTWQILCSGPGIAVCNNILRLETRIFYFQQLLALVIIAALIIFIWPLWTTHQVMVRKRTELHRKELKIIGQKINDVSQQIIRVLNFDSSTNQDGTKVSDKSIVDESKNLHAELEALQKAYTDLEQLPVWPFNKDTVLQLISTQGIPLLGLTGIGTKIMELLEILFKR